MNSRPRAIEGDEFRAERTPPTSLFHRGRKKHKCCLCFQGHPRTASPRDTRLGNLSEAQESGIRTEWYSTALVAGIEPAGHGTPKNGVWTHQKRCMEVMPGQMRSVIYQTVYNPIPKCHN